MKWEMTNCFTTSRSLMSVCRLDRKHVSTPLRVIGACGSYEFTVFFSSSTIFTLTANNRNVEWIQPAFAKWSNSFLPNTIFDHSIPSEIPSFFGNQLKFEPIKKKTKLMRNLTDRRSMRHTAVNIVTYAAPNVRLIHSFWRLFMQRYISQQETVQPKRVQAPK